MKCPKCGNPRFKFKEEKHKGKAGRDRWSVRKSNMMYCSKCGFEEECKNDC
jgi:predicted nucleic-acid-binding Zn-ribbon protein